VPITSDLSQFVAVGAKLKVDYVDNALAEGKGEYFKDCPAPSVALLAYSVDHPRPEVPELPFKAESLLKEKRLHVLRITKFDAPGDSGVEGGVAEIVDPARAAERLARAGHLKDKLNMEAKAGSLVRFHRSNLFHLGSHLAKADLRYFFSTHALEMNLVLAVVEEESVESDVKQKVSLGWKLSCGAGEDVNLKPVFGMDSLMYPSVVWNVRVSAKSFFNREGFDCDFYEDILNGDSTTAAEWFGAAENVVNADSGYMRARVEALAAPPPIHKQDAVVVVMGAFALLEGGENAGQRVYVSRASLTVCGVKAEKANLQHFLRRNDLVYVKVKAADEKRKSQGCNFEAEEVFLGWPHQPDQKLSALNASQRKRLLLFLESRKQTAKEFEELISSAGPATPFVPLRSEMYSGEVVELIRDNKNKLGAVSGKVKLTTGPMTGQSVTFQRKNAWLFGHHLGQCDLTYVFRADQARVNVEVATVQFGKAKGKDEGEKKSKSFAAMLWVGAVRPNGKKPATVGPPMAKYLRDRGLTAAKFLNAAKGEGELAAVGEANSASRMLPLKADPFAKEKAEKVEEKAKDEKDNKAAANNAPVFRHGEVAAKLCDMALSVSGPNDPRIKAMIRSDSVAQMAFHMQKALEMAVEHYKSARQAPWAQGGGQNGSSGPLDIWSMPQATFAQQRQMLGVGMPEQQAFQPRAAAVPFGDGGGHPQPRAWRPMSGQVRPASWKGGAQKRQGGQHGGGPKKVKKMA